jgi:hypothetical protein
MDAVFSVGGEADWCSSASAGCSELSTGAFSRAPEGKPLFDGEVRLSR